MKILIYGPGVVGSTYGWQLHRQGHEISVLVRKEKYELYTKEGIHISCQDFREGRKNVSKIIFRPHVIDELRADNDFDYIIVSTTKLQISEVLPVLKESAGKANIVFFQNIWDYFDEIAGYLRPEQYFFSFPFMLGGGRKENKVQATISGLRFSHTPIGEADGTVTDRVRAFADILEKANLKPRICGRILDWLISHYAVAAGLSAGVLCAGSAERFVQDAESMKKAVYCIREGFKVCLKRGVDLSIEPTNRLQGLPLWLLVPLAKKVYSNEGLQSIFNGHIEHAPDEIRQMLDDMIESGKKYGVEMPHFIEIRETIRRRDSQAIHEKQMEQSS
ncbi:MAG: 2-dehydropantoate 2-reductase N-terminal domain-containing protein [Porphyromonas sp.]|nr:2-dehydropantoate 2-reductase N-terminal domain-containing protein [Porphyromonas sp.]